MCGAVGESPLKRPRCGPSDYDTPQTRYDTPQTCQLPRFFRLPFDVFDNATWFMKDSDKNNLKGTCKSLRDLMNRVGVLELNWCYRQVHQLATQFEGEGPRFRELAAKIMTVLPPNFLGSRLAPRPRTGLLHPLLSCEQRMLAIKLRVHDFLSDRERMDCSAYNISDDHSPAFLFTFRNSISSWPLVQTLMEWFGPWAFGLAIPAIRAQKEYVLTAATLHGDVVLRYVGSRLLSDSSCGPKLCEAIALYNLPAVRRLAIFLDCQARRYLWTGSSADSVANVRLIARWSKEALAWPDLHNDEATVTNSLGVITRLGDMRRTERRIERVYGRVGEILRHDASGSGGLCHAELPGVHLNNTDLLAHRSLTPFKTDPEFLATLAAHRDLRSFCLYDIPAEYLNRKFWQSLLDNPLGYVHMEHLVRRMRDDTGKFSEGAKGDIIPRCISYLLRESGGRFALHMCFDDLYPPPFFPEMSVILEVFSLLSERQDRVRWLTTLLLRAFEQHYSHAVPFAGELIAQACSMFPQLNDGQHNYSWQYQLAFILASVMETLESKTARHNLIRRTMWEHDLSDLHSLARGLLSITPSLPPPPALPSSDL